MTTHRLSADYCRCPGIECNDRETCLRYLAIAHDKEGYYSHAIGSLRGKDGKCEYKINAKKETGNAE